jgi:hypothetical protein
MLMSLEGFVGKMRVIRILRNCIMAEPTDAETDYIDNSQLDWVEANYEELAAGFADEWIAVLDNSVIAHAPDTTELHRQLVAQGVDNPLIMWVSRIDDSGESPLIV